MNITTTTKKINASWSKELVNDLKSFHMIDASVELEKLLHREFTVTIRRKNRKKKIEKLIKHTS